MYTTGYAIQVFQRAEGCSRHMDNVDLSLSGSSVAPQDGISRTCGRSRVLGVSGAARIKSCPKPSAKKRPSEVGGPTDLASSRPLTNGCMTSISEGIRQLKPDSRTANKNPQTQHAPTVQSKNLNVQTLTQLGDRGPQGN